jgi:proteasome lid subunit RPN8/RPN11
LLEGTGEDGGARITALHPVRNLAARADRFEMHPQDQFAAAKAARPNGRSIIGCYHSHPNGAARFSNADLAGASENNFIWLIAAGNDLAAFVYFDGSVTGADLVTSSL